MFRRWKVKGGYGEMSVILDEKEKIGEYSRLQPFHKMRVSTAMKVSGHRGGQTPTQDG